MTRDEMIAKLRAPVPHYTCYEDKWYSCPLSEDGCSNEAATGCICGATEHTAFNLQVANALEACANDAERIREYLTVSHANIEKCLAAGKGEWPKEGYVRDEIWARWKGQESALRQALAAIKEKK